MSIQTLKRMHNSR